METTQEMYDDISRMETEAIKKREDYINSKSSYSRTHEEIEKYYTGLDEVYTNVDSIRRLYEPFERRRIEFIHSFESVINIKEFLEVIHQVTGIKFNELKSNSNDTSIVYETEQIQYTGDLHNFIKFIRCNVKSSVHLSPDKQSQLIFTVDLSYELHKLGCNGFSSITNIQANIESDKDCMIKDIYFTVEKK